MNTADRDNERIDETLEETFPASDPPANTVETGISLGIEPVAANDGRDENRPTHPPDRPARGTEGG